MDTKAYHDSKGWGPLTTLRLCEVLINWEEIPITEKLATQNLRKLIHLLCSQKKKAGLIIRNLKTMPQIVKTFHLNTVLVR